MVFQNPAAVFFASKRQAQRSKGKIRIEVDHPEGLLQEIHGCGRSGAETARRRKGSGCARLAEWPSAASGTFDQGQEGAEHFQVGSIGHFAHNGLNEVTAQIRRLEKPWAVQAAEGFLEEESGQLDFDRADPDFGVLGIADFQSGQEVQQRGFNRLINRGGNIGFFNGRCSTGRR